MLTVLFAPLLLSRMMSCGAKRLMMLSDQVGAAAAAAPKRPCLEMRGRRMLALLVQTCNKMNEKIRDPTKHVPIRFDTGEANRSNKNKPLRPCAVCATQISKVHITAVAQCSTCFKHVCGECEKGHFCRIPGVQRTVSDTSAGGTSESSESESESMSVE